MSGFIIETDGQKISSTRSISHQAARRRGNQDPREVYVSLQRIANPCRFQAWAGDIWTDPPQEAFRM